MPQKKVQVRAASRDDEVLLQNKMCLSKRSIPKSNQLQQHYQTIFQQQGQGQEHGHDEHEHQFLGDHQHNHDQATVPTELGNNINPFIPLNIPLVLGPLRFLTTSQTAESNFIPPPYLVVEIDDGLETVLMHEQDSDNNKNNNNESGKMTLSKRKQRQQWQQQCLFTICNLILAAIVINELYTHPTHSILCFV